MLTFFLFHLGLKTLLSKQWAGKGFGRDLNQILDLLYSESYQEGDNQVWNFKENFLLSFIKVDFYLLMLIYFYYFDPLFEVHNAYISLNLQPLHFLLCHF